MASSSSRARVLSSLISGEPPYEEGASVVASFRTGGNSAKDDIPEYVLLDGDVRSLAEGHLTWDPDHGHDRTSPFHSVAMVRFKLTPEHCRWSVGTADFIDCGLRPYGSITKFRLVAGVRQAGAPRTVQWESADVTLHYRHGDRETFPLMTLPRAANAQASRRAATAPPHPDRGAPSGNGSGMLRQYADVSTENGNVVGMTITGQVTLRANDRGAMTDVLDPEDLQGSIVVFMDQPKRAATASA